MKLCAAAAVALLACTASATDNIEGNAFGNPHAPILIEVFSDFQCPGCKSFHDYELTPLMQDFITPGKAYLIYRYYPLEAHLYGRKAAALVCGAARLGKFEAASNLLFARQESWSQNGKIAEILDTLFPAPEQQKLRELAQGAACQAEIAHDVAEGKAIPVTGTPFVTVTYRTRRYPLENSLNYALIKSFLEGLEKK